MNNSNKIVISMDERKETESLNMLYLIDNEASLPDFFQKLTAPMKLLGDEEGKAGCYFLPNCNDNERSHYLALVRLPKAGDVPLAKWSLAEAYEKLPAGDYQLRTIIDDESQITALLLGWLMAGYSYTLAANNDNSSVKRLVVDDSLSLVRASQQYQAVAKVRDLINMPPNILTPESLADALVAVANQYDAEHQVITGQQLLVQNYPSIHAVGRAADTEHQAPRLAELLWGDPLHPKVTLVGKGVCFDSGGLDIKSAVGMRAMKKDMGGAAHVLGLAQLIMESALPVRLQVLIPAVENAISGDAFRPGDVINTRLGKTIEIDNTDAEGRLILIDALAKAVESQPEIIIDFATLTGASRVATGTEVPSFFSRSKHIRNQLVDIGEEQDDLIWPLPLHKPYMHELQTAIADLKNSGSGYAGAITAALFLAEFVPEDIDWVHIDCMAYNLRARPGKPIGGEAMGMMTMFTYLQNRFG
jgi:leucyl aminopeptidase